MKRSLLFVYPHLLYFDGGTKFLFEVTKRLKKEYIVTVLVNTGSNNVITDFKKAGTNVITLQRRSADSNIYWLFLPLYILKDFLSVTKYCKQVDVILASLYPSNFLVYLASIITKKSYYYYCYEPFPYLQNKEFINMQKGVKKYAMQVFSFLYRWTDSLATKNARKVFTLNTITQRSIIKIYGIQSIVTLMGVDTNHFRHIPKNSLAKIYAVNTIITHATDYTELKRTDLAIQAIKYVVEKHKDIRLIITSTNPNSPNKQQYIKLVKNLKLQKYVQFVNFIPYASLPNYYSISLCYLSTSTDAMLGTTSSNLPVKEAMACETPAIRANITDEDVIDGKSGHLVNPQNSKLVADKILYLLNNQEKAKEMGRYGRKTIMQNYQWDDVVRKISQEIA